MVEGDPYSSPDPQDTERASSKPRKIPVILLNVCCESWLRHPLRCVAARLRTCALPDRRARCERSDDVGHERLAVGSDPAPRSRNRHRDRLRRRYARFTVAISSVGQRPSGERSEEGGLTEPIARRSWFASDRASEASRSVNQASSRGARDHVRHQTRRPDRRGTLVGQLLDAIFTGSKSSENGPGSAGSISS